ncbi:ubiquitin fusion degradation protein [Verticillium dahliae]
MGDIEPQDNNPSITWSASFSVVPPARSAPKDLRGDKILLPQSALEHLLAASRSPSHPNQTFSSSRDPFNPYATHQSGPYHETSQLPNPLTFRLVNPINGNAVHAGIREFSAEEGQVALGPYLMEALGIDSSMFASESDIDSDAHATSDQSKAYPRITIHAKHLPKGTYVRLRPLEAGYNPDDWKSLLERQLRQSFTTLTKDAVLAVRGVKGEQFQFLIDKFSPEGDGICVVDTDLEVDIEALNEEQARETLRQIMAQEETGSANGSSKGGTLDMWKPIDGQVVPGQYVDFQLPSWNRSAPLIIELSGMSNPDSLDLFVSPKSSRQRALPRDLEHVFGEISVARSGMKTIILNPTNVELEDADQLLIAVHGYPNSVSSGSATLSFTLRARSAAVVSDPPSTTSGDSSTSHSLDDEQCQNCRQWVPSRTILLHQNFCRRNNVICPRCKSVFKKGSPEWEAHWHCEFDDEFGDTAASKAKHDAQRHSECQCSSCGMTVPSLVELALHRTSVCPGKLILCRFCHLEVPQEGDPLSPSAEVILSGLSAHEVADGARTTECHLCNKIVRMRDMSAHMKHHELDKVSRRKPDVCRNANCGRTLHGVGPLGAVGAGTTMGQGPSNDIGLCSLCFGPLYVSMHDPRGKALRRRIERRYLSQMMTGCGKSWCANQWCKTGRANAALEAKAASAQAVLPLVKPLVENVPLLDEPLFFCVDERNQTSRKLATVLASDNVWEQEWCIAACEAAAGDLGKAREWLHDWAPMKGACT